MLDTRTRKLTLAGILVALAVLGGLFSIPVLGSRCAPVQHLVNILAAVFLGPLWGIGVAFTASLLRNITGLGSLMAFPGSMIGALSCGPRLPLYEASRHHLYRRGTRHGADRRARRLSRRSPPHGAEPRELHRLHRPLSPLHRRGQPARLCPPALPAAEAAAGLIYVLICVKM